jgi:hypothetical protein
LYSSYHTYANQETQSYGLSIPAIHPDAKVLTVDYTCHDSCGGTDGDDSAAVVGIDIASGSHAFRVKLANSIFMNTNAQDAAFCGNSDGNGTFTT